MEFRDVLRNRRAVRDYAEIRVTQDVVERLVGAAILAPSAMNLQPWAFAALLDPKRLDAYAGEAKQWLLGNPEAAGHGEAARRILAQPELNIFHHAPALVMVLATSHAAQAAEDCCLAAENLMLAARDEGLGTCWIGLARPWLNLASTKREMGIAEGYAVVAPIILGYPRAWPVSHGRTEASVIWL